jgi:hypothetical protein
MSEQHLPNLIIAGVTKAGTTSVFMYLKQHPEICVSDIKETCYFLPIRYHGVQPPLEEYAKHFAEYNGQKYIMEATAGYFYGGKKVAQAIKDTVGADVKIIVVLREPISRLTSFYKYLKSRLLLPQEMTLAEYVKGCEETPYAIKSNQDEDVYWGVEGGFYHNFLMDWIEVFGDAFRVVFFDDIVSDANACMKDICLWLALDSSVYDQSALETENKSVNFKSGIVQQIALWINDGGEVFWRRYPTLKRSLREFYYKLNGATFEDEMDAATKAHLQTLFAPANKALAVMLKERGYTRLPKWLEL